MDSYRFLLGSYGFLWILQYSKFHIDLIPNHRCHVGPMADQALSQAQKRLIIPREQQCPPTQKTHVYDTLDIES
jgi:hypothetical protein